MLQPISPRDQQYVIAYLIGISPDLRQGVSNQRKQEESHAMARESAHNLSTTAPTTETFNLARSKTAFETSCVQCHALKLVDKNPPRTQKQAEELVARMVDNGLEAPQADLQRIIFYLKATYAK